MQDSDSMLLTLTAVKQTDNKRDDHDSQTGDEDRLDEDTQSQESAAITQPKNVHLKLAEDNFLSYIFGYIANKIKTKLCDSCQATVQSTTPVNSNSNVLLNKKQYANWHGEGLVFPTDRLTNAVTAMERVSVANIGLLTQRKVRRKIVQLLYQTMKNKQFVCAVGACDIAGKVVSLFVNIRLHFTLRDSTASFAAKSCKHKKKILKIHTL